MFMNLNEMKVHDEEDMSANMLGMSAPQLQNLIEILKPMTNPNNVYKPSIENPKAFKAVPITNKVNQLIGYKVEPIMMI